MYTFESRVRFSEIDHTETMTLPALVNYFQDCSTFQSESLGLGIDALKGKGKAWLLSSWQIVVERYPKMGEEILVDTWPTGFERMCGNRNFRMRTKAGEVLAYANSVWVYMDIIKGRPARPDAEEIAAYKEEEPLKMDYAPRKILLPEHTISKETFPVRRFQIDTNEHVNNCQYIQMALEVMPECERASQVRVEYKKSAVLGDMIYPRTAEEEMRKVVILGNESGEIFATVEFKAKRKYEEVPCH